MRSPKTRLIAWCSAIAAVVAGWAILASLADRIYAHAVFIDQMNSSGYWVPEETAPLSLGVGLIFAGIVVGLILILRRPAATEPTD